MSTPPVIQLHLFFATENDSALILRRAGRQLYNLIAWDRATDTFTEGQWLKKSVQPDVCDLSPDGRHFIYAVRDAYPETEATANHTVISRPPWFTALALFPHEYSWLGGGSFLGNGLYRLNGDAPLRDIRGRADGLRKVVAGKVTKDCRTGLRLLNGKPAPLPTDVRDSLLGRDVPVRSSAMDRYETQGGRLYRREGMELSLIRDFTEMEPQFVRAPYDERPDREPDTGWHPIDAEHRG